MNQVVDPRLSRLKRYSLSGFDVHGMECLVSVLNVETDSIYHCINARNGSSDRLLVPNVRLD